MLGLTSISFRVDGVEDVPWVAASEEQNVCVLFGWEVADEGHC